MTLQAMHGQWVGRYAGSNQGFMVADLDDVGNHYEGHAYAFDDIRDRPAIYGRIQTPGKTSTFELKNIELAAVDGDSGIYLTWDQVRHRSQPGIIHPTFADISFRQTDEGIVASWKTNIGTFGEGLLTKSYDGKPSDPFANKDITNWKDFKNAIHLDIERRYIYRGQEDLWRLRTGFHRTGRADLIRFQSHDIPIAHRHLSQHTKHVFDLNQPDQKGAFVSLMQHHGYPTPLLDWSFSPYVAAFFAYRKIKNSQARKASPQKNVRIFKFDQLAWNATHPNIPMLTSRRPHFTISEFIALDNPRSVPQQSITAVTNVDDIERYIQSEEQRLGQTFLEAIDLPVNERPMVMKELGLMGVTAGSLFPGIDGTCEELRERMFDE